jgi:hypothetical protein
MMVKKAKPALELGIEFAAELLLFFIPYGAEQTGIPHNFWVGLGCWVIGATIAIRMFWIFPLWAHRTRLEKGLIVFIVVALFIVISYKPVTTAYDNRDRKEEARPTEQPPAQGTVEKTPPAIVIPPTVTPIPGAQPLNEKGQTLINSYPMKVTYNCTGDGTDKETQSLVQMEKLNNSKDYASLLEVCQEKIQSVSGWRTPYLFCSLGYLSSGNADKARELLKEYEDNRAPTYFGEPCKQISDFLHSQL